MYDLAANLNTLIIMINTNARNIPTTTVQKQQYCARIYTAWINFNIYSSWYYLISSLAVQSPFIIHLDNFHRLISVGFALHHQLAHCPALTSPLKPGLHPFLPCTMTDLTHHRCPCANFLYIFHLFLQQTIPPCPKRRKKKKNPLEDQKLKEQPHIIHATITKLLLSASFPFHQEGHGTTFIVQLK